MKSEYDEYTVKKILIKHDVLHKDIDQLDDPILMEDLYKHFQEDMPYGTQKARTGDPDEFIYDALERIAIGRTTIIELLRLSISLLKGISSDCHLLGRTIR